MAVLVDVAYKNRIGERLTNRIGMALRTGEVQTEDTEKIITMVLAVVDHMQYKEELVALFTKLSAGWPFFKEIPLEETT